ncbi:MAG: arsenate reductase family protein [Deltaproteobacteria bacterium]|nr:arsenate reductase family protein [Deltaproteobacteria bacterium]
MTTLYWYSGCSTCKRARKFLAAHDVAPTVVELKTDPPGSATLADLHRRSGLPLKKFFNTAGQSYRNGGFKDRLSLMSEQEQYDALAADGMLIKRPILDLGAVVLVGFKDAVWSEAL